MKLKNIEKLIADNSEAIKQEVKAYVKTIIVDESEFDSYFDDNYRSNFLSSQGQEQKRLAKINQAIHDMEEAEDYIKTIAKVYAETEEDEVGLILMKNMSKQYLEGIK